MAEKTVQLTHPNAEKPIEVPESEADKYLLGGWSPADSKTPTK